MPDRSAALDEEVVVFVDILFVEQVDVVLFGVFCGTAHNVASSEMLYVSGSSGAQFDERAAQLRGTDDVVSAITTAASEQQIAE